MYNSKEELIALDNISPGSSQNSKTQLKKSNKIHSPLVQSPIVINEKHVVSMFSAKTSTTCQKHKLDDEKSQSLDSQTLSDLSDEVFIIEKSETCPSKSDASKSYKDKIKDRFKNVKQQAGKSSTKATISKSSTQLHIERIRRESTDIDSEVKSVRSKFHLGDKESSGIDVVQFFTSSADCENDQDHEERLAENCAIRKVLPEKLGFNMKVSEKECCFIPKSKPVDIQDKIAEDNPRYPEEEGLYVNYESNVAKIHLNILEQRLASSGEKKWFNCDGSLYIISDPSVDRSVKPIIPTQTNENRPLPSIIYKLPKPKNEIDCEEIVVIRENILELCVVSVKFIHHPLLSPEHVLKEKLTYLYEKYQQNTESNHLQKIKNRLEALRHVKKNAELIRNQSGDSSDEKIRAYIKDIKKLREEYLEESKKLRDTLRSIIQVWKIIKKLREVQKYSSTNVKLLLKKEKVDYLVEKSNYDDFFEETLKEVEEESKNCSTNKRRKIKRKHKTKANSSEKSDSSENAINEESESENKGDIIEYDQEKIAYEVRKRFEECLKPPGEPNIKLLLTNDHEITQDTDNPKETIRRQVVATTKFGIKIICNQIDVCKSKLKQLNDNFELEFDESFSIQLSELPEYLTVELTEYPRGLLKKKICQIQVSLPSVNAASNKICAGNFVKNDVVHYKHAGVGSGIALNEILHSDDYKFDLKFPISLNVSSELNTAGILKYSIRWESNSGVSWKERRVDDFDFNFGILDKVIDKSGAVDATKFSEWMEKCAPDPQDPKNCVLYEYMQWKDSCTVGDSERKYFRLSPYSEMTNFCDISELDKNLRFQILQLRDQHELEFDNIVVPNRVKEIAVNLLVDYKKRKSVENRNSNNQEITGNDEVNDDDDEFENVRNFGKKHIKLVYSKVFQNCKNLENNLDYDSVVNEKYLTYFEQLTKTLLKNFVNWFRWHPQVTVPLPTTKHLSTDRNVDDILKNVEQPKVFIKIISAKCIPSRVKDTFKTSSNDNCEETEVCPFVEVSHNEFRCRTSTQTGSNCLWNETIVLPLDHQQTDYLNPNSLNGNISIALFDENHCESQRSSSNGDAVVSWIGGVTVPLSAVCSSTNLNGMFKVRLPPLLLAYETEWEKQTTTKKSPKHDNAYLKSLRQTYLEMEISVTQPVPVLSPNMAELPSNDVPYIREHILEWNERYNASFPNRKFHAMAIDSSGRTNCVTKYIRPLEPPQINTDEFDVTPDQCARYVSLIPVTDCSQFYGNVWLTSEQLIKYMLGSINDQAVTLTCFLLALKQEAWLLMGYGVPHGSTSYVLVREYNAETTAPSYSVYDAVSCEKYSLTDPYCPLQKIYCLINGENVWGNIQRTDNVILTRFDLERRSDWLSLFNDKIESPTNFINTKINYKLSDVEGIELRLERKVRRKISKLRQLDRTVWNHSVSSNVKNFLKIFEINSMYGKSNSDTVTDLKSCLSQYKVNGYLLNIPFTSFSDIIKIIKKTNIHIQEPTVYEFILAVSVQSYPGQVFSVWIFLAVILDSFG